MVNQTGWSKRCQKLKQRGGGKGVKVEIVYTPIYLNQPPLKWKEKHSRWPWCFSVISLHNHLYHLRPLSWILKCLSSIFFVQTPKTHLLTIWTTKDNLFLSLLDSFMTSCHWKYKIFSFAFLQYEVQKITFMVLSSILICFFQWLI